MHCLSTLALVLASGACSLLPGPARADEDDRALLSFTRPRNAPAPRNAPVQALEWERLLRAPDRLGPTPVRTADAALLAAAREGRFGDALQLVKTGQASANARDERNSHALVPAARAGQDDLVRELIQRGAETDRIGEDGSTALGAAAAAGQRSTVRLLLQAGADAARQGAGGQTALHLASLAGQLGAMAELLRGGRLDVDMLNRQRETALDVAAAAGQQDAMAWLIGAGADITQAGRR